MTSDRAYRISIGVRPGHRFGSVGPIPPDHAASGSSKSDCRGGSFDPRHQLSHLVRSKALQGTWSGLSREAGKRSCQPTLCEADRLGQKVILEPVA